MAKKITGTNRADRIEQNNRPELTILSLGGDDTIILDRDDDNGGDNTVDAGQGNDTVLSTFEGGNRIKLGAGNDTFIGTGFSLTRLDNVDGGTGNDRFLVSTHFSNYKGGTGNDLFFSTGFNNDFFGGAGNDTISYQFRHEDSVVGDTGVIISLGENGAETGPVALEQLFGIENAIGSINSDTVAGSNVANRLSGLAGDDTLHGLGGNDILTGGLGKDVLFGGTGRDTFVFSSKNDSPIGGADEIRDFSHVDRDIIDLSGIDANPNLAGNQKFKFIGGADFSGKAGEVRFENGIVLIDINGNRLSDMIIGVDNILSMQAEDFIL